MILQPALQICSHTLFEQMFFFLLKENFFNMGAELYSLTSY